MAPWRGGGGEQREGARIAHRTRRRAPPRACTGRGALRGAWPGGRVLPRGAGPVLPGGAWPGARSVFQSGEAWPGAEGAWPVPPADSNLKRAPSRPKLFPPLRRRQPRGAPRRPMSGAGRAASSLPPPPWSPRPPASRSCCERPSSWSGGSAGQPLPGTRRAWPRPSTATPHPAPRRPAGPRAGEKGGAWGCWGVLAPPRS